MRLPFIYKIIAPLLLVVFTITSCNVFVMPELDTTSVPIGKGDIRFVYLDENYQPTTNDIGKMAMYVENNELAKDILVMAEIPNDDIDNSIVVRVINKQNNSLVSFFYFRGQYFPHKVVITADGENIIGQFSLYNPLSETYSVTFTYENGESDELNDFVLNKNIFSLHKKDSTLTDTQNVRISHIITTLGLWNSLAFQLDDDFNVDGRNGRTIKGLTKLSKVFAVVAVVAFVAVLVIVPPASVIVTGATLTVSLTTTSSLIVAGIAVAAAFASVITDMLSDMLDKSDDSPQSQPPPSQDRRPMIEVTLNNNKIENNGMPPYYLKYDTVNKKGESLTFNLKVTDLGFPAINIDNIEIRWFEPTDKIFIDKDTNQLFFTVKKK